MASVQERVVNIIAEQLGVNKEQITTATDIANDLGADSLDIAELMIAFEEEFDIDIVEEDAQNITTVGQVVDHISKAIDAK
ncbi:MAG: acyl carrier protein [Thermoguttaceae bacterium]